MIWQTQKDVSVSVDSRYIALQEILCHSILDLNGLVDFEEIVDVVDEKMVFSFSSKFVHGEVRCCKNCDS